MHILAERYFYVERLLFSQIILVEYPVLLQSIYKNTLERHNSFSILSQQSGVSQKTLTKSKHQKPSLQNREVRTFPQNIASLMGDMTLSKIYVSKQSQGWDLGNTCTFRVLNKVSFITRYVSTTHNMAKKLG